MNPQDPIPDNPNTFDRLLENRSEIAEFVNSFSSPSVQKKAFEAVVHSLGLAEAAVAAPVERLHIVKPDPVEREPEVDSGSDDSTGETGSTAGRRRRNGKSSGKRSFSVPRGLNFAPEGQPSLEAFVADKQPRNNDEKNLIACVYLVQMMGLKADTEHVLAVYQAAEWDAPARPHTSLQNTAHKYGWIDTADMKDIKVVWKGENYLTTKMPVEPKKKSG